MASDEDIRELRRLKDEDEPQLRLLFQWLRLGAPPPTASDVNMPDEATEEPGPRQPSLRASFVEGLNARYLPEGDEDTTPIWVLLRIMYWLATFLPVMVFGLAQRICPSVSFSGHFTGVRLPPTSLLHRLQRSRSRIRTPKATDRPQAATPRAKEFHFVWWNAWLYSGSDNLWAGLIKALHDAVEERYGGTYAMARNEALMISIGLQCVVAAGLLAASVVFGVNAFSVFALSDEGELSLDPAPEAIAMRVLAVITTSLGSLGVTISALRQYLFTPRSRSAQLVEDAFTGAMRKKLGFMHMIKKELERMGKMLQNERPVPTFLDYLLPTSLLGGRLHKGLLWLLQLDQCSFQPCIFIIYVDDLDRCPPEKSVEVLQSLVLLTEGTPFVIFLAIDPRIVVSAIETSNKKFFNDAGINGYEYLDKIVNIPFVIPQMADNEKSKLCSGFLSGGDPKGSKRSEALHDGVELFGMGSLRDFAYKMKLVRSDVLIQMAQRGEPLIRCQDAPHEVFADKQLVEQCLEEVAEVSSSVMAHPGGPFRFPGFVVLEYVWESPEHPDPNSLMLKDAGSILEWYTRQRVKMGLNPVFVVSTDWMSMPQRPRSPLETELFRQLLSYMNVQYGHIGTVVIDLGPKQAERLSRPPLTTVPSSERGWPTFTRCVGLLVKHWAGWLDSKDFGGESSWSDYEPELGQLGTLDALLPPGMRRPPMIPEEFLQLIQTKRFTNGADREMVFELYGRGFQSTFEGVSTLPVLDFSNKEWSDDGAWHSFAQLLPHLTAFSGRLVLSHTGMSDQGLMACIAQFAAGCLPKLTSLDIEANEVSDAGVIGLADALSNGALPRLKSLRITHDNSKISKSALEQLALAVRDRVDVL